MYVQTRVVDVTGPDARSAVDVIKSCRRFETTENCRERPFRRGKRKRLYVRSNVLRSCVPRHVDGVALFSLSLSLRFFVIYGTYSHVRLKHRRRPVSTVATVFFSLCMHRANNACAVAAASAYCPTGSNNPLFLRVSCFTALRVLSQSRLIARYLLLPPPDRPV